MLVSGGHVVDPSQKIDSLLDVRVENGVVSELGEHLTAREGERVFDARGSYVAPGFIDMHVHLREPGNPEKETLQSGTAAAVAGGFTALAAMPNTDPAIDTPELVRTLRDARMACRIYPVAAMTRGRKGEQLLDYAALAGAGAVAFSDDGNTVMDAGVMYAAAMAARSVTGCFIAHCEDARLKGSAPRSSGGAVIAEDTIVARDLIIAGETRKAWHIAHLSTIGALSAVRRARELGTPATCEVTPHHLWFTDDAIDRLGSGAKVNPPLRTQHDVDALRKAVMDGDIDAFATDHAPHTEEEKSAGLECGAVGFSGLEIAVGAYAFAVPSLPLNHFVEMLSCNPARILGVAGGTLRPGSPADITVFADRQWRVDPALFRSKGKSTPFAGLTLPRKVLATIVAGEIAFNAS